MVVLSKRRSAGFSMPELLVSVTMGLLIVVGMVTLFFHNSRAQAEVERANRQIESGRYAVDLLANDLRNAGFYGEFDPTLLPDPAAVPDPCAATLAALKAMLPLHVQGFSPADTLPSCVSDVRAGTALIVVRHTRACVSGDPNCSANDPAGPLFQASLCSDAGELGSADPADWYALDIDPAQLLRTRRDCTTAAVTRRYQTHIYFVANNDEPGDGIPTLKRAELRYVDNQLKFKTVPLAEGVENLQLEYGIDTSGNGSVGVTTSSPAGANGCTLPACAVSNWRNVVAVRLHVLARSPSTTPGWTDSKTYNLGTAADGTARTAGPFNDGYKRHVFQTFVTLANPVGRKQP
ncbi:PilW family protein [Telluria mixta]|uniref:PilW family protein n=1 Tax=Telluria mixta TaxID=34071 RepID=A0ABT2C0L5_9BURK|nr:PilW family protein [Telluria mixta]MCS0630391.1 PilW family protein [Telluria mixta]WEM94305.1 PilW family protein [Telluria mixta]